LRKIRIVMARLGMDAHWRGSVVVARALRDAGLEVVYLGNQMPEAIAQAAIDEDVDLVGLSTLSGNHLILAPEVVRLLREKGQGEIPVVLGGTVPPGDVPLLKAAGVADVFGPGSSLRAIVEFVSRCAEGAGPGQGRPPAPNPVPPAGRRNRRRAQ
jgi:methylmalonyl-CoA mutase C-terminal domain/subunit